MDIERRRAAAGVAAVVATAVVATGVAVAQTTEGAGRRADRTPDPRCVAGGPVLSPDAAPWEAGLAARSDALNRLHGLGRYAPGAPCAEPAAWLSALIVRSEGLNAAHRLGGAAPPVAER